MKSTLFAYLFGAIALLLMVSCDGKEDAQMEADAVDLEDIMGDEMFDDLYSSEMFQVGNVSFTVPSAWKQEKPESSMRFSQFGFENDEDSKIAVFFFDNNAGTIESNIARWKGEFVKLDSENEDKMLDGKVIFVSYAGVFKKRPMPMAEEFTEAPDYATLGGIVSSADGTIFIKLNGPASIVNSQLENFKAFLNSAQFGAGE